MKRPIGVFIVLLCLSFFGLLVCIGFGIQGDPSLNAAERLMLLGTIVPMMLAVGLAITLVIRVIVED